MNRHIAVKSGSADPTREDNDHRQPKERAMSEGKFDRMKGRAKEAAGELTDDDDLKDEGKVDKASGAIKEKFGNATDKVKDAVNPDR
jgi:uncharacterized protein YjbJ (UPF0337 family)